MKAHLDAALLVALGCLQMFGDLTGQPVLKAIGTALQASPAPKVFTAQNGFETYSSKFYIDWQDRQGARHSLELTPRVYRELKGPYNRRNAYGAAISYAPVLASSPRTKPMLDRIAHYGFCDDAPLLSELRIPRDQIVYPLHVRLEPRDQRSRSSEWQHEFTISCDKRVDQ
jgi:hypothetical protein